MKTLRAFRLPVLASVASLASIAFTAPALAADAPLPSGAHPRLWIGAPTLSTMKANLASPSSAASKVVAGCTTILLPEKASEIQQAGIEGYNWAYSSATCALAWKLTGDATYLAPAITLFNALLDDYQTIGDGAGGDTVVQTDTGYGMRFYGAYSALLYDWLHDAPGVDATLLAHARARFATWTNWYDTNGYMKTMPGSNYHAGYVFAKTLISIAEAGEGGNDQYWTDVTNTLFPEQIIAAGLAPKGNLTGGDWPEGWEYGPMSTMEYALAARALSEQGVSFPEMTAWADSLAVRAAYGLNPSKTAQYAGGDLDDTTIDAALDPRVLIATLAGPGSAQGAGYAQFLKSSSFTASDMCPVFDALAEARAATATDFTASKPALSYVAPGTRNVYARSSWDTSATWSVFTSAPRLGPDHQHLDDSNFVIEHGADTLIADPSPYGSLSTLTGNGITVDSNSVEQSYRPSQSPYGSGDLAFTNATADGVAAARAEIAPAFGGGGNTSDVPLARRDWTFLLEGEVVTIDRVTTNDASRSGHLRLRSPATLTANGGNFVGTVGQSKVVIHPVSHSGGTPAVDTPTVGDCWSSSDYGVCAVARYAVTEYTLNLPGPSATAVHVIDALGASDTAATAVSMSDDSIDPGATENGGVLGSAVTRSGVRSYVVASATGTAPTSMVYGVPGDLAARHVVFDAPADSSGHSSVTAEEVGGRCELTITAGGSGNLSGTPLVFELASATGGCAVSGAVAAPTPPTTGTSGSTSAAPDAGAGTGTTSGTSGSTGTSSTSSNNGSTSSGTGGVGSVVASSGLASGCTVGRTSAGETWRSLLLILGTALLLSKARRRARSDESQD